MSRWSRVPPIGVGGCWEVAGECVYVGLLVGVIAVVCVCVVVCCVGFGEGEGSVRMGSSGWTIFLGVPIVGHFSIVFGWGLGSGNCWARFVILFVFLWAFHFWLVFGVVLGFWCGVEGGGCWGVNNDWGSSVGEMK